MCIMFSPANESLLCINCFRDLPPDIRAQCLDLDTAYQQKCERLQRGLKAVGELEVIIKDEVSGYRALLKELHINAMREESTIHVFSKILQGVVSQTEERLIETVKRQDLYFSRSNCNHFQMINPKLTITNFLDECLLTEIAL